MKTNLYQGLIACACLLRLSGQRQPSPLDCRCPEFYHKNQTTI